MRTDRELRHAAKELLEETGFDALEDALEASDTDAMLTWTPRACFLVGFLEGAAAAGRCTVLEMMDGLGAA